MAGTHSHSERRVTESRVLLLVNKPAYEKGATAERSNFAEMTVAFAIQKLEGESTMAMDRSHMLPVTTRVKDERTPQRVSRSFYSQSTVSQSTISQSTVSQSTISQSTISFRFVSQSTISLKQ